MTLLLTGGLTLQSARMHQPKPELKTATFAGGCFWGVQAAFDRVPGVVSTEAGYTGGTDAHPTHMSVTLGHSGDVEAVRVTYDARKISLRRTARRVLELSQSNARSEHRAE